MGPIEILTHRAVFRSVVELFEVVQVDSEPIVWDRGTLKLLLCVLMKEMRWGTLFHILHTTFFLLSGSFYVYIPMNDSCIDGFVLFYLS